MRCPNCGSVMRYLSAGKVHYCEYCKYEVQDKQVTSRKAESKIIREVHYSNRTNKQSSNNKPIKSRKGAQKKRSGCLTVLISILILFVFFGWIGSGTKEKTVVSQKKSNSTAIIKMTEKPPSTATVEMTDKPASTDYVRMSTDIPSDINNTDNHEQIPTEVPTQELAVTPAPLLAKAVKIEDLELGIREYISAKCKDVVVNRVLINKDFGTEVENDYIVLLYLTSNINSIESNPKLLLEKQSNDLAETIGAVRGDIQEICFFWTIPLLNNASGKISYENKENGMTAMDIVWDSGF